MHEKSLVRSLLKQVKAIGMDNGAVQVDAVTVELGPLSGAEPELVAAAYDELVTEYFEVIPQLDVHTVPLQLRCRFCLRESAADGLSLVCPVCTSLDVQIIRGDEFRLIDVSLQVPV